MQVDPIKPTLNAPGAEPLKQKCDELLSNFAYKFNLRRYTPGTSRPTSSWHSPLRGGAASMPVDAGETTPQRPVRGSGGTPVHYEQSVWGSGATPGTSGQGGGGGGSGGGR